MDVSTLLTGLNEAQREAVSVPPGDVLVLAGAGSGKTRVLVHRVAWLIQVCGFSPWSILAVTFTNKAAGEMRGRIEALLGMPIGGMWVGTFHGLSHRLLRSHWKEAALPDHFQVMDTDDQLRLVRRVLKQLNLDETRWPPKQAQWFINGEKDAGRRPQQAEDRDPTRRQLLRIYQEYEDACRRTGCVDFAELLLRAYELWRQHPQLLEHYQTRFQQILVDEFQDTNSIQYAWLRLLAGERDNLFVVGDDDQSIYGWRGAQVQNLRDFRHQYPHARLLRLEQNYRSTSRILKAANAVIACNPGRLGKTLWTQGGEGEPLRLYAAFNEVDEARFVIERLRQHLAQGEKGSGIAILYRTTAQSRLFEEALIQAQIPYRVYGGMRFFERAEIKEAMAYLRLIVNADDDASFERVIATPPRGIGVKTMETIRDQARLKRCSLWTAAVNLLRDLSLPARTSQLLNRFLELIERMRQDIEGLELAEAVEKTLAASGLAEYYAQSKDGKGQDRIENLDELVNAARQYVYEGEEDEYPLLQGFLAHAALEAGEMQEGEAIDRVQLMTLHSAKGLEFPLVFIVGLEEGLFPHSMSSMDPSRLEEERRLCYVGMTRAMHRLYLSYAETRRLHGSETYPLPSRFLREIPAELVEEIRPRAQISRPLYQARPHQPVLEDQTGLRLGQQVVHPTFGQGVILNAEGQGSSARVQVKFATVGSKWLVVAYAKLQAL